MASQVPISRLTGNWLFGPRRASVPHSDNPVYQDLALEVNPDAG